MDLWYTLIYQNAAERASYERARRAVWKGEMARAGLTRAELVRALSGLDAQSAQATLPARSWSLDDQVCWLALRTGRRLDPDRVHDGLARALGRATVHVTPGARHCLTRLRRAGVRVGLVSNIVHEPAPAIHALLGRLRLAPLLRATALSPEVRRPKPDPFAFHVCLGLLRAAPRATVHIGDSPADVEGARRGGLTPWLFLGADRFSPGAERRARRGVDPRVPRFASWAEVEHGLFGGDPPVRGP